jgi:hypothetical protein
MLASILVCNDLLPAALCPLERLSLGFGSVMPLLRVRQPGLIIWFFEMVGSLWLICLIVCSLMD